MAAQIFPKSNGPGNCSKPASAGDTGRPKFPIWGVKKGLTICSAPRRLQSKLADSRDLGGGDGRRYREKSHISSNGAGFRMWQSLH